MTPDSRFANPAEKEISSMSRFITIAYGDRAVAPLLRRTLALTLLPAIACAVSGPLFSGSKLVAALQRGGCVVLMRHASSPGSPPDRAKADAENVKLERQLDADGRESARAMGEAFRRLRVPVGDVLASRAVSSAR